jgi:MbtH protein
MDAREGEDTTVYAVVVNHEEQYTIWAVERAMAPGWRATGKSGSKAECLDHIKRTWSDMRPLSLRNKMQEQQATTAS